MGMFWTLPSPFVMPKATHLLVFQEGSKLLLPCGDARPQCNPLLSNDAISSLSKGTSESRALCNATPNPYMQSPLGV